MLSEVWGVLGGLGDDLRGLQVCFEECFDEAFGVLYFRRGLGCALGGLRGLGCALGRILWVFGVSAAGRLVEERSFCVWVCLGGLQPPRGGCPWKEGE